MEPEYLVASSVSAHTANLPNFIEVGDSDDESDASVKEVGIAEDDDEKKLYKQC